MQGSTRIDELRQKFHENPRRYFAPLANEYRKAGDPEQAIAICRAHLAQQPGHMSGHVVYGQALYDARRTEEARTVFEKALALDPDNAIVLRQLGDIAREKGEDTEARHWYVRALEADPGDKEVAAYIAELTEPVMEPATEPAPHEVPAPVEPAVAAQAAEMVSHEAQVAEPQVAEPQELEIAMPEASREPEVEPSVPFVAIPEEIPPAPAEEEVTWRKTPPHEDSPFVTRTMAELYAKQGYREAALDVYRQLALHHPDDKEIFDRIEALEKQTRGTGDSSAVPRQEEQAAESQLPEHPRPTPTSFAFEPLISDVPSEPEPETGEVGEQPLPSDAEDLHLDTVSPMGRKPHFTELELSAGDSWDTDAWGAGFSAEDETLVEFESPDVHADAAPSPEVAEPEQRQTREPPVDTEPAALESQSREGEPEVVEGTTQPASTETEAVPQPAAPAPAPEPQAEPVIETAAIIEPPVEEPTEPEPETFAPEVREHEPVAESEPVADAGPVAEREPVAEPQFVAYSPQLPADEDLPHFAPTGPTVREFFAALGAYRPPSPDGNAITAHAASTELSSGAAEYPLATDAFANLFADSPVSDEDSRAAFALSGALGAPAPATSPAAAPPLPPEASPAASNAQESEEDIRRFREWLDGLAES